jgi:hypothetical protein
MGYGDGAVVASTLSRHGQCLDSVRFLGSASLIVLAPLPCFFASFILLLRAAGAPTGHALIAATKSLVPTYARSSPFA